MDTLIQGRDLGKCSANLTAVIYHMQRTVPNENFNIFNKSKTFLSKCLTQGYHKIWKSMLNQTSKSLCYRKHESNINLDPYLLQVRNKKCRRMLAKLRLSDHKLEIETGSRSTTKS